MLSSPPGEMDFFQSISLKWKNVTMMNFSLPLEGQHGLQFSYSTPVYIAFIASYLKASSVGTPLCVCMCVRVYACVCVCVCVCMHACMHAYVHLYMHGCVWGISSLFCLFNSNPILFSDLIYYFTSSGREFLHCCDVVHKYSEEVIVKRRKELLEV